MNTSIYIHKVNQEDNLKKIIDEINNAQWDEYNEISHYDEPSLKNFIEDKNNFFITTFSNGVFAGLCFGHILTKAYSLESRWIYVDEVDVPRNYRRQGIGQAMMKHTLKIMEDEKCEELWVATESDNIPAQKLYKSLKPSEIQDVIGYLFTI